MTDRVTSQTWFRRAHITGPSAVLVSIRFGVTPPGGPVVIKLLGIDEADATPRFDVDAHVSEVLGGIARANAEFGGSLQVENIQIVPSDYPSAHQAEHAAYLIGKHVLTGGSGSAV